MYSFFYDLLAGLTGGKRFEAIRKDYYRQVRKTLKGEKFSNIDTQVFALLTQRKPKESLRKYLKRKVQLHLLSHEDKQRLIDSEKTRLYQSQKEKDKLLYRFLGTSTSRVSQQQTGVTESVEQTLNRKLSQADARIFDTLTQRRDGEYFLSFLKRHKAMHARPIEQKLALVREEQKRLSQDKHQQETLLSDYLRPSPSEVVYEQKTQTKEVLNEHEQQSPQDLELDR